MLPTAEGLESGQASEIKEGREKPVEDGGDRLGSWPKGHLTVVSRQVPLFTLNSVLYYTARGELDCPMISAEEIFAVSDRVGTQD